MRTSLRRRRSTLRSSAVSTPSSSDSTDELGRDPGRAARGVPLVPRAVCAAARPRLPLDGLRGVAPKSSAGPAPPAGWSRRASRSSSASRRSSCSSGSARRCSAAACSATSSCSRRSRASCSSCSGSRSWASCPGPSGSSAQGSSRAPALVARASSSAARSPSAPRRASGRCWRRSSSSPAPRTRRSRAPPCSRCTRSASRSRSSSPARSSRARWAPSAGSATTTARSSSRAALVMVALGLLLFFGRFYVLRIYVNRALEWLGLDPRVLDPHREEVEQPLGDAGRCRLDLAQHPRRRRPRGAPARRGRVAAPPSRAGASRRRWLPFAGVVPGDRDVDEALEEVPLRPPARRATRPRAPRARRTSARRASARSPARGSRRTPASDRGRTMPMATILLVGVDLMFRSRLDGLLAGHRLVTSDSADPPDLVICDIARSTRTRSRTPGRRRRSSGSRTTRTPSGCSARTRPASTR